MKFIKVYFLLLLTMFIIKSEAIISINLDPEDLDQVNEFFQNIVLINQNQNQQLFHSSTRTRLIRFIMKIGIHMIQLCSVMVALVGSNKQNNKT